MTTEAVGYNPHDPVKIARNCQYRLGETCGNKTYAIIHGLKEEKLVCPGIAWKAHCCFPYLRPPPTRL